MLSQKIRLNRKFEPNWEVLYAVLRSLNFGTTLVVQRLRLCPPNAGGPGSIPGQVTRSHMLQLRVHMLQLKILHAATKTWHSQINK